MIVVLFPNFKRLVFVLTLNGYLCFTKFVLVELASTAVVFLLGANLPCRTNFVSNEGVDELEVFMLSKESTKMGNSDIFSGSTVEFKLVRWLIFQYELSNVWPSFNLKDFL